MKTLFARFPFVLFAGLACLLLSAGCEVEDDDYDHDPPPGKGSIIVDNHTYTDIEFFVEGRRLGDIGDDHDEAFDLRPGVYRVVLNDEDDERAWGGDVDVLEGKLTVLDVHTDSYDSYDVSMSIE